MHKSLDFGNPSIDTVGAENRKKAQEYAKWVERDFLAKANLKEATTIEETAKAVKGLEFDEIPLEEIFAEAEADEDDGSGNQGTVSIDPALDDWFENDKALAPVIPLSAAPARRPIARPSKLGQMSAVAAAAAMVLGTGCHVDGCSSGEKHGATTTTAPEAAPATSTETGNSKSQNAAEIQKMIDEAVKKATEPLNKRIAELEKNQCVPADPASAPSAAATPGPVSSQPAPNPTVTPKAPANTKPPVAVPTATVASKPAPAPTTKPAAKPVIVAKVPESAKRKGEVPKFGRQDPVDHGRGLFGNVSENYTPPAPIAHAGVLERDKMENRTPDQKRAKFASLKENLAETIEFLNKGATTYKTRSVEERFVDPNVVGSTSRRLKLGRDANALMAKLNNIKDAANISDKDINNFSSEVDKLNNSARLLENEGMAQEVKTIAKETTDLAKKAAAATRYEEVKARAPIGDGSYHEIEAGLVVDKTYQGRFLNQGADNTVATGDHMKVRRYNPLLNGPLRRDIEKAKERAKVKVKK